MNWESIGLVLGGLGLFLLGMSLMTDGLRFAAGDSLSKALQKMTGSRFRGIATGAAMTALVQSSSATTLMTVGLVSAGVISFASAVGIIFGANIGTTMTSWLVAMIGLKFKISLVAFPLVGVGAIAMVMGKGTWKYVGQAVTGFALLFLGIDSLQAGMKDLSELMTPETFDAETIWGRLILVLVGGVMTVVMQSSSAAVASTLTALDSGAISVGAAAALVIGQNVGTTVTSIIASIGASIPAKRTAMAHVLFNLLTGVVAFLIFPVFELLVFDVAGAMGANDPAAQIAAFHTAFNVLGVMLLVPFVHQFSELVERIIPGKKKEFVGGLTQATLTVPVVAIDAVRATYLQMMRAAARKTLESLGELKYEETTFEQLIAEKLEADRFLMQVSRFPLSQAAQDHHLAMMHASDHMDRYLRVVSDGVFWKHAKRFSNQQEITLALLETLSEASEWDDIAAVADLLDEKSREIAGIRASTRAKMLKSVSRGVAVDAEELDQSLRYVLSADRCAYHLWRCAVHLSDDGATHDPGEP